CKTTDKHTSVAPCQPIHHLPGILQRLPGNLEQEPLLRIEPHCFARGNAKKLGVKLIETFQVATSKRIHFTGLLEIGVVKFTHIPTITGDLSGRVGPRAQKIPEGLWAGAAAGEVAPNSNDRKGLSPQAICESGLRFPGLLPRSSRTRRLVSIKHSMPPYTSCPGEQTHIADCLF